MQLFQHLERFVRGKRAVVNGHITHFADKMNGIEQNLIVEIAGKRIVGGHFKDGFALNVAANGAIDHFDDKLHGLPRRGDADIRL